jgi:hypothetical protein
MIFGILASENNGFADNVINIGHAMEKQSHT